MSAVGGVLWWIGLGAVVVVVVFPAVAYLALRIIRSLAVIHAAAQSIRSSLGDVAWHAPSHGRVGRGGLPVRADRAAGDGLMPAQGVATIVLGGLLAATLVAAVSVILVQLLRTSAVLADVDDQLAGLPRSLAGVDTMIARINRGLRALA